MKHVPNSVHCDPVKFLCCDNGKIKVAPIENHKELLKSYLLPKSREDSNSIL